MAKKTASRSAKRSTKTAAKQESKAPAKKVILATKAEAEQKETAKQPELEIAAPLEPQATLASAESEKAAKGALRPRDPRLPVPGTILQYKGTTFRSLSAAAMAASKDLGLGGGANGFLFGGLIKQAPRAANPVAVLERAWVRYREKAKGIMAGDLDGDVRHQLQDVLQRHSQEVASIG